MSTKEKFDTFIAANPDVWALFVQFAREAREAGHQHLSSQMIMHRIRWQTSVETYDPSDADYDQVKIGNNYSPYYARKLMSEHPEEFAGFFRLRKLNEGEAADVQEAA